MVADDMDKLITDNDSFRNVVQSLYARSYILSLSVGHSRPKAPSNKVIIHFIFKESGRRSCVVPKIKFRNRN